MAAKKVIYGEDARAKLKAGVDKLANAVGYPWSKGKGSDH